MANRIIAQNDVNTLADGMDSVGGVVGKSGGGDECLTVGVNVYVLLHGEDRYLITYEDGREQEALQVVGRWAANPELSFDWFDATRLAKRIRAGLAERERENSEGEGDCKGC